MTAVLKVAGFDPAYPAKIVRQKIEPTGALAFDPLGLGEDDEIENDDSWVGIEEIELKEDENYEPEWLNEPESSDEKSEPVPPALHDDPEVDAQLMKEIYGQNERPEEEEKEETERESESEDEEDMQPMKNFHPL